ncbi:hypothetical protein ACFFWD_35555 [Bradyrhizobium erythrophlei]|uniref:hypothetical protein n=1 Tax=Bradyrhizobium erythrophlei TaxID=1437360 RepID=UPI0035E84C7A
MVDWSRNCHHWSVAVTSWKGFRASVGHFFSAGTSMSQTESRLPLTSEQTATGETLRLLLGTAVANRYLDFCELVSGTLPLHTTLPLAAHALRELEALVRAVLAAPMDAVIAESPEAKIQRRKAVESLKAFGYDDDALQGVSGKLEPRVNHRLQIERICDRLGLYPDADVVVCWQALRDIHGSAHQRHFDKSLRVDDEFRERYARPFDVVMRGLASALEDRYAALLQRAMDIAAMPPARGIKAFVAEIPGAGQLQHGFYESLNSEDWLPLLDEKGLLGEPLFTPEEDDTGFRQWPVGRYLLRMAASPNASTRAIVVAAVRALAASTHPDVQLGGVEIAAVLPADDAAMLADTIAGWLMPGARLFFLHPATVMKNLARGGQGAPALRIAAAFFQVFSRDGRLATLHDQFMYEHFLSDTAKDLIAPAPVPALELFCDLLRQVAVVKGYLPADEHGDRSHNLLGDIDGNPQHRDIPTALAAAIVDAATQAIHSDGSRTGDVITRIRSRGGGLFERIAMRVVASSPGNVPELATAYLVNPDLIGASWCRTEYDMIANVWFPTLDPARQQTILDHVDSFVDEDGWRKWFVGVHDREPNESEAREYGFNTIHDIVGGWRNVLPAERQRALDAGVAEFGAANDRHFRIYDYAKSPRSSEEMHSAGVEATIAFLSDRDPSADENSARETTALAGEFRTAVSKDPVAYSSIAVEISELAPIFVRRYLEAMDTAAFNAVPLDWSALLALLATVSRRMPHRPDDPDRYPILRACIALMVSGLGKTKTIDVMLREEILSFATALHTIASNTCEPVEVHRRPKPPSFVDARQTLTGGIVELCILALNWLDAKADRSTAAHSAAAAPPGRALRSILEQALADRSDESAAPRMVMGRYLNRLYRIEGPWLKEQLPSLLPVDDEPLRMVAWLAHLQDDVGPVDDLIAEPPYRACYVDEIYRMSDGDPKDREARGHRLAGFLITLFLRGSLPEELLTPFLERAPISERQEAMRLIGLTIGSNRSSEPSIFRDRAESYWLRRLSAAKATGDPSQFAREIGSIGLWFLWGVDTDWLTEQLLDALAAGYAPNDLYTVIGGLAKLGEDRIDRVIEVLEGLATNPSVSRYALMVQPVELRKMLTVGKASRCEKTRRRVDRLVNVLASKGVDSFIDLLE